MFTLPTSAHPPPPPRSHPSIRGRLHTTPHRTSLSAFAALPSSSDSESESEPEATLKDVLPPRRRKRPKKSRLARPRDAMPYLRRRHHRTRKSAHSLPSITARHLDRSQFSAQYHNEENGEQEGDFADTPPALCSGHGEECVRLVCKRGEHEGRPFWKCARKGYLQCDFFAWADAPVLDFNDNDASETEDVEPEAVVECDEGEDELLEVLGEHFGYDDWREGQKESLGHLLKGQSTLAVLPTGGGKSLIYQMYALLRPGLVLVISPLVALMADQVASLPEALQGVWLSAGMGAEALRKAETRVRKGEVKVLFVAPERVLGGRLERTLKGVKVGLVVVDEAHCMSLWSHHFRTALLRLGGGLKRIVGEQVPVLGLSATMTERTVSNVCEELGIGKVVRGGGWRGRLLTVSSVGGGVEEKVRELVRRLSAEPFVSILGIGGEKRRKVVKDEMGWGKVGVKRVRAAKGKGSVLVYVGKQKDCESVTNYLRSSRLDVSVACYHGGMSWGEREKVQKKFEKGGIAVLVATVAFGMGVDYGFVGGVVHFDMPTSIEGYVQEVGRAGRGEGGVCCAFWGQGDADRVRSRCWGDGVDRGGVRKVVRGMVANAFEHRPLRGEGKAMILYFGEGDLAKLDTKFETAETICAILEREIEGVAMLNGGNTKLRIKFFSQKPEMLLESESKAVQDVDKKVVELVLKWAKQSSGQYDVLLSDMSVIESDVWRSLNRLQAARHVSFEGLERGVFLQCDEDAYRLLKGEVEQWADVAQQQLDQIERVRRSKADAVVAMFKEADDKLSDAEQSSFLHERIQSYFSETTQALDISSETSEQDFDGKERNRLEQACKVALSETSYSATPQSARQVARILHGLTSPLFPAKHWHRFPHWSKFTPIPFSVVMHTTRTILRSQHKRRPS